MSVTAVLGVIAIRVMDIFTVSHSIVLTVCCMVISAVPLGILPGATYIARSARSWASRSEQEEGIEVERMPLSERTDLSGVRFASIQVQ